MFINQSIWYLNVDASQNFSVIVLLNCKTYSVILITVIENSSKFQ